MKAIIFDFDGVIVDTFEPMYKLHLQFRPESDREKYKQYFDGNFYQHKNIKTAKQSDKSKFFKLTEPIFESLEIPNSIRNPILELHKTYQLYIITSNQESTTHHCLQNNGLDIFDEILGYESHLSKVEKFDMLIKKHNLNLEDCIFVTDTLGDLVEANEVGIRSIAILGGYHEKERLEKGKPYRIAKNLNEVLEIVQNI